LNEQDAGAWLTEWNLFICRFFKGGLVVSGKWRVKVMTERRWLETSSPEWGTYKKDRWARVQHQEQSDAI
jgi:hypothetical protein